MTKVLKGLNDFSTWCKQNNCEYLLAEWDYEKNAPLLPNDFLKSSGRMVWWIDQYGHSWKASISHRKIGTGCPYCAGQKVLVGFNDLATKAPALVDEWNYEKNTGLKNKNGVDISTPDKVCISSGMKVWWKCDKGHEWQATIHSRTAGNGCPFCSGNIVLSGFNDLQTRFPEIAKEWCYKKNKLLLPENVLPGSHRKVWWICSNEHEYQAAISSRTGSHSCGCPYCSGRKVLVGYNDMLTTNPEIAKEWNAEKNYPHTPKDFTAGSNIKVWWKCKEGHEWKTSISHRTSGRGCPYCSGKIVIIGKTDLFSTNSKLAAEWNYEKNYPLTPRDVKQGANKVVWWKCKEGHEWKANINSRSSSNLGCPICSNRKIVEGINDLSTTDPILALEWNYEKNGNLKPTNVGRGSSRKVWWCCERGHQWKTTIVSRKNGNGCPYCSNKGSSMPEQGIAFYLTQICKIEQRTKIANQEVDIFLPQYNLGIEYDGVYFHQNASKDKKKDSILRNSGLKLIRVIESNSNEISKNGYIYYVSDNMGKNYEWALKSLFKRIVELTGDKSFASIDINIKRDRLKIRERFNLVQKENSLETFHPKLIKQWNTKKNGILKPNMFSSGSDEKVWWICEYGHEWQATISNRVQGRGCPVCNNTTIIPGVNDLATLNPLLADEWCYGRNGDITPEKIALNARFFAWWLCPKCGGEYQSWVYSRSKGVGCPYCSIPAKRVLKGYNDLVTKNPELISEWNYEKNGDKKPDEFLPGSNLKVWWKCKEGHEWEASVAHRSQGEKCPYCSGRRVLRGFNDMQTLNPSLAEEWDFEKNKDLNPTEVSLGSNKKVYWKCKEGHEWMATVCSRATGIGCPICAKNNHMKKVINIDTGEIFKSVSEASQISGINNSSISLCCKGKLKTAGGYHWQYIE